MAVESGNAPLGEDFPDLESQRSLKSRTRPLAASLDPLRRSLSSRRRCVLRCAPPVICFSSTRLPVVVPAHQPSSSSFGFSLSPHCNAQLSVTPPNCCRSRRCRCSSSPRRPAVFRALGTPRSTVLAILVRTRVLLVSATGERRFSNHRDAVVDPPPLPPNKEWINRNG
jgi:hypothetical protein